MLIKRIGITENDEIPASFSPKKGKTVTKGETDATVPLRLVHLGWTPHHAFSVLRNIHPRAVRRRRDVLMFIVGLGAVFFGLIIGWMAYRILRHRSSASWLSDLMALLGIITGAAVLAFFRNETIFGWYALGLVIGFFGYFAVGVLLYGKQEVQPWRSELLSPPSSSET